MPDRSTSFLNRATALIALVDSSLTCQQLSPVWKRRLGLDTENDQCGLPVESLFEDVDAAALRQHLLHVVNSGNGVHGIPVNVTCIDEPIRGQLSAWVHDVGPGGSHQLVLLVEDVEALSRAVDELSALEAHHETILSAAGEGIYGIDRHGRITFGNAASTEILGWSMDEIMGKPGHDIHHHSHADGTPYPRETCPIYAALRDGEVHRVDHEVFWHMNGSPVEVEYTSTPILKRGEPDGAVVVFRDITLRRRAEREREDAFRRIQQLTEQLEQERDYLRDEISVSSHFGDIIGQSDALKRTLAQVEAVAVTQASVLIYGESGVGKEMIARAIHAGSPRSHAALIKVNCASIPGELFESEFFGHVRGAFTGAHADRVGRMKLADGGTLFLDEVGEIPLAMQSKLLRVLQEQEFERVGDGRTIAVDVRIVAATNRDLMEAVRQGQFREDLYYRLSVFPIEVPPLRQRRDDIAPLAMHFVERFCREMGRDRLSVSNAQIAQLTAHDWPGNVRELTNVIERAVILSTGSRLRLDLAMDRSATVAPPDEPSTPPGSWLTEAEFRQKERENMRAALQAAGGQIWGENGAAHLLGIKPSTFRYRMKRFGVK